MQSFPVPKQQIIFYLKKNWFKISLGILLLFLVLKKDFSFQINLKAPTEQEIPVEEERRYLPKADKPSKRETFTDKQGKEELSLEHPPIEETFDVSPFAHLGAGGHTLENQLKRVDIEIVKAYIKRFAHVAENEQIKFKIPASITLANALLQSQAGQHPIAQRNNNNFGLVCTKDWIGDTIEWEDQCFRDYENAWTSFRDHSLFLTTGANSSLQKLGEENYKGWAKALEKINFAGQKNIANQIIHTIEKYQLYRFDSELE